MIPGWQNMALQKYAHNLIFCRHTLVNFYCIEEGVNIPKNSGQRQIWRILV